MRIMELGPIDKTDTKEAELMGLDRGTLTGRWQSDDNVPHAFPEKKNKWIVWTWKITFQAKSSIH